MDSEDLAQKTRFFIRRLAGIGRTGLQFDHLSYTAYSGFEITKVTIIIGRKRFQKQLNNFLDASSAHASTLQSNFYQIFK